MRLESPRMNNDVIFAAAGNGKTYGICKEAIALASKTDRYILLVTYTNEGVLSLGTEYRKQNCGVIDKNVKIRTWYSFVLSDLIKPYQCLLKLKSKEYRTEKDFRIPENYIKSIAFYQDGEVPRWYCGEHIQYYVNAANDINKNNVSCLADKCIEHSDNKVIDRLKSIYSHVFFDELQDYAGWDLEIIKCLFDTSIYIKCVGDYKQATFRTNNSLKYRQYRDEKIKDFFVALKNANICSLKYSNTTRRFNQEICNFVNMIHKDEESFICPCEDCADIDNAGVYIIDDKYIEIYCKYYNPTILRYKCDSKINFDHKCSVFNYGNSKGATFDRTVIVPVGTVIPFINEQIGITSNQTRSKFFVACTRARHSLVFAMDNPKENKYFKQCQLIIGEISIPAFQYQINGKL